MISADVLIVGAGLSGLCLARELKRDCLLLEKSRGVGGRIATRRIDDLGFDHGAPNLPDDSTIRNLFQEARLHEALRTSSAGVYHPESMTQLPKSLAKGLTIRKSTKVEALRRTASGWELQTDGPEMFLGRDVVLTAPLPQAIELLDRSRISVPDQLRRVTYTKAVMALVITQEVVAPELKCSPRLHSVLSMRERRLHPRGFVVRASDALSEELFDRPEAQALEVLLSEFLACFSTPPALAFQELKKWRYVLPKTHLSVPYTEVSESLWLTGDSFHFGDARGSVVGAKLLAKKLS